MYHLVDEQIYRLTCSDIRKGKLEGFGAGVLILCHELDVTPEDILDIGKTSFETGSYYNADGTLGIPHIKRPVTPEHAAETIRHWLTYWGLLMVLCDEGSAAPATAGIPIVCGMIKTSQRQLMLRAQLVLPLEAG